MADTQIELSEVSGWQDQWEKHQFDPEDLHERSKRYGRVFEVFDEASLFVVRMMLPQRSPNHELVYKYGLPLKLKPYKVTATLEGAYLQIYGEIQDASLALFCGLINSFPDRFELSIPLDFEAKNLEVYEVEDYIVDIKVVKH